MIAEPYTKKCPVCGKEYESYKYFLHIVDGEENLDGRRNEPLLFSLFAEQCSECGFINNLIREDDNRKLVLRWNEIKEKYGFAIPAKSLSSVFFRAYLVQLYENGDLNEALDCIEKASWAADDEERTDEAIRYREIALGLMAEINNKQPYNEHIELEKIDFLRRNGRFDEAEKYIKELETPLSDMNQMIVKFQSVLIKDQNRKVYTVKDAFEHFDALDLMYNLYTSIT